MKDRPVTHEEIVDLFRVQICMNEKCAECWARDKPYHKRQVAIYREAIRRLELAELVLKARTVSVSVAGKRQFVAKRARARRRRP